MSPGSLSVRVELDVPDRITGLEITVPTLSTDIVTTGMTRTDDVTYRWDGQTNRPYVDLTVPENAPSNDPYGGVYVADAGDWAVVEAASTGSASWQYRGASPEFRRSVHVTGEGAVSSDGAVAYLGPYDEYRDTVGGQITRLVVPSTSDLITPPSTVLTGLSEAASVLEVGELSSEVLAVALPTTKTNWGAMGRQAGDNGFWVQADASMTTPNNTWLHEYVHTRQSFGWTDETRWLLEATANYYAGVLAFQLGYASSKVFEQYVDADRDANAILSAPDQWPSRHTPYQKGMRVLAALDHRIRTATNGVRSFTEVFASINKIENLTHTEFVDVVDTITESSNRRWLDRYVGSPACPEIPRDLTVDKRSQPTRSLLEGEIPEKDDDSGDEGRDEDDTNDAPDEAKTTEADGDESGGGTACPICGTVVPPDQRYCSSCGNEVGVIPEDGGRSLVDLCPVCNTSVDPPGKYCPQCGAGLTPTCPVCDTRYKPSMEYCANCGHRL
jgi:predicted nucleic acid-binding Zn ribbon protein